MISFQLFNILGVDVVGLVRLFSELVDIIGNNAHTVQHGGELFHIIKVRRGIVYHHSQIL